MRINEVEALVGVTKKNIRFYEEQGLLHPGRNSDNGYREYGEAEIDALRRIKLLRKLGVPIQEIRYMQEGRETLGDGMRRHIVTLERERRNLEESMRLCTILREREIPLSELDAEATLHEMEELEQSGTSFRDTRRQDVRIRYLAPVIAAIIMVVLMGSTIWLLLWAATEEPDAPPLILVALLVLVPLIVIGGVLLALAQRIKEIGKGEIDDAKKY